MFRSSRLGKLILLSLFQSLLLFRLTERVVTILQICLFAHYGQRYPSTNKNHNFQQFWFHSEEINVISHFHCIFTLGYCRYETISNVEDK